MKVSIPLCEHLKCGLRMIRLYRRVVGKFISSGWMCPGVTRTTGVGKCSVCGLDRGAWVDRRAGMKLCEHCYNTGTAILTTPFTV